MAQAAVRPRPSWEIGQGCVSDATSATSLSAQRRPLIRTLRRREGAGVLFRDISLFGIRSTRRDEEAVKHKLRNLASISIAGGESDVGPELIRRLGLKA
jgi:hypothetical protein